MTKIRLAQVDFWRPDVEIVYDMNMKYILLQPT